MQGYTHTCAACDAKLKIHERYVGRALHCPTCGTEFLADPTLADIDDIIDELVPDRKRSIPWLPIIAGLALLVVAFLWLGTADRGGPFSKLFKPERNPGQFAVLAIAGQDRVPAAMDRETVVFLVACHRGCRFRIGRSAERPGQDHRCHLRHQDQGHRTSQERPVGPGPDSRRDVDRQGGVGARHSPSSEPTGTVRIDPVRIAHLGLQ